jgi:hypothetical protein
MRSGGIVRPSAPGGHSGSARSFTRALASRRAYGGGIVRTCARIDMDGLDNECAREDRDAERRRDTIEVEADMMICRDLERSRCTYVKRDSSSPIAACDGNWR